MKRAAVILAEGFEEIEALTPVDLLRRAGITVNLVGLVSPQVTGARGLRITADLLFSEFSGECDLIILPGGMPGARNLANHKPLGELLRKQAKNNKLIGAICAAPALVLGEAGLLDGREYTCYPGMDSGVRGARYREQPIVQDGLFLTSRGVGTAHLFSLALIKGLVGEAAARDVAEKCLIPWPVELDRLAPPVP